MSRVGLVGLGLMGTAIAERLSAGGFSVLGWDLLVERRTNFSHVAETQIAKSVENIFGECDKVLLSLPNDAVVRKVLESVFEMLSHGQTIIDTSTGDPAAVFAIADKLKQRDVEYLDATVSGSSEQVRHGSAAILVGASNASLAACEVLLKTLSNQVLHVGPPGCGSQMKLVTNLVLGLNRAALAEGLSFAQSLGLSAERVLEVLRSTMAYSRTMDNKGEKMIARDFTTQAKLDQHAKDVRLILANAERGGLRLPLSEAHLSLLKLASQLGFGDADNSAIIEAYQRRDRSVEGET